MKEDTLTKSKFIYTDEELQNISEWCVVLRSIRSRLIKEGFKLKIFKKKIDNETKNGRV
jgi:hypothetical protein